jgi:hypothetical protein
MSDSIDVREQLYNDRRTGPIYDVQLPTERVTRLHGVLFDLDPKHYTPGNATFPPADDPRAFHNGIRHVLDRHALARHAEVRASGTGLHLILWLEPNVELRSAADQQRWAVLVEAVQRTLPVDPDMPGITALTRKLGSRNGKNGALVEVLREGQPVQPAMVENYVAALAAAPFKQVAHVLLGGERVTPCPVCRGAGSRLDVLDHVGRCYNGCSKVTLEHLYDRIFKPVGQTAQAQHGPGTMPVPASGPFSADGGAATSGPVAGHGGAPA